MRIPFLTLIGALSLAASAAAMTTVPRDLDQLVARADAIFRGTATSRKAAWKGEGANRHIVTRVTFRVGETYKGAAQARQTLEFFGGELDGMGMGVADMPTFAVGDEAVLFVEGNERQVCPLVGAEQGAFRVRRDSGTSIERVMAYGGSGIGSAATIGKPIPHTGAVARALAAQSLTVSAFRGEILQRVDRQKQGLLRIED